MPLVLPNQGLTLLLDILLKKSVTGIIDWTLMLWTNTSLTPSQSTVLATLTAATFTGYSPQTLVRNNWTSSTIISDHAVSTYTTSPILWTCTASPQDIYGYAIYDSATSVLLVCEKFAAPVALVVNSMIGVLPRITLTTEP